MEIIHLMCQEQIQQEQVQKQQQSFIEKLLLKNNIEKNKSNWSLSYQRTILGTNETFKIDCALINDTCRIYIDEKAWKTIFNR